MSESDSTKRTPILAGKLGGLSLSKQVAVLAVWPLLENAMTFLVGVTDIMVSSRMAEGEARVAILDAMGLGGYLAARTDVEHFAAERLREEREVEEVPEREAQEVEDVLRTYGLSAEDAHKVTNSIRTDKQRWVDFMMRFELGLEEPDPRRASRSAMTIAGAYVAGGLVPLSPYALVSEVPVALAWSVAVTLLALLVFGYIKGRFTTSHPWRSAWQTVLVGGLAASAAFLIAKAIG
jgi:VIT1/CCC1 family predicted Fe2+/Mn2+ transporter